MVRKNRFIFLAVFVIVLIISALHHKKIITGDDAKAFFSDSAKLISSKKEKAECAYAVSKNSALDQKIAFVSRHDGTRIDFTYLEKHLNLENVEFFQELVNVKGKEPFILTPEEAVDICEKFDVIFVSDCLSDGWEFIRNGEVKCKNVVFLVTNRYDMCVSGKQAKEFKEDLNQALTREDEYRATLVVNNAFEIPYMQNSGIEISNSYPLIRPFGSTNFDAEKIDAADLNAPCLITSRVTQDEEYLFNEILENTGHKCKILPKLYGGPKTLSQYNSIVVHIPYQVSIMKMWENIAHGVLMAVPSPDFLELICRNDACNEIVDLSATMKVDKKNWTKFVDFYNDPSFSDCFIQFNSWDELDNILTNRDYLLNQNKCRDKMEDKRFESIAQWREFLSEIKEKK